MAKLAVLLPAFLAFLVGAPPALAWTWPAEGPVLRPFVLGEDPYAGGQHRGIDVGAVEGSPVLAPAAGRVSFAGTVPGGGKTVTLLTPDGYAVTLQRLAGIDVVEGADVAEGAPVGLAGSSLAAEHPGPYLHLGIRREPEPHGYLDPLTLLPARSATAGEASPAAAGQPAGGALEGSAPPAAADPPDVPAASAPAAGDARPPDPAATAAEAAGGDRLAASPSSPAADPATTSPAPVAEPVPAYAGPVAAAGPLPAAVQGSLVGVQESALAPASSAAVGALPPPPAETPVGAEASGLAGDAIGPGDGPGAGAPASGSQGAAGPPERPDADARVQRPAERLATSSASARPTTSGAARSAVSAAASPATGQPRPPSSPRRRGAIRDATSVRAGAQAARPDGSGSLPRAASEARENEPEGWSRIDLLLAAVMAAVLTGFVAQLARRAEPGEPAGRPGQPSAPQAPDGAREPPATERVLVDLDADLEARARARRIVRLSGIAPGAGHAQAHPRGRRARASTARRTGERERRRASV